MNFFEYRLNNNPGVMQGKLTEELFTDLKSNIDQSRNLAFSKNENMIGQLEKEYYLILSRNLQVFLLSAAQEYQKMFQYELNKKPAIVDHWLNIQKKHEYQPVHNHSDLIAWVIWVNIPYELEDELNQPNCKNTRMKRNSAFEFVYCQLGGEIKTNPIFLSNKDEGTILMFPSKLRHAVYPFFTSDEERISVAGNISLIDKKTLFLLCTEFW